MHQYMHCMHSSCQLTSDNTLSDAEGQGPRTPECLIAVVLPACNVHKDLQTPSNF